MPRRFAIIGNAGGGKSLLAQRLGQALELPVHVVDDVQWQPGWTRAPLETVARAHADWLAAPHLHARVAHLRSPRTLRQFARQMTGSDQP